jgi:peptide/nickel transport system substrate-binding protein
MSRLLLRKPTPLRRTNSRLAIVVLMVVAAGVLLAAVAVVAVAVTWGTAGGSGSARPSSAGTPQPGGILKVGMQPGEGQYDPVLMDGATGDVILVSQVQEPLVELAQDFSIEPLLATTWSTPDGGKTWKLTLRDGVKFSNGQPFTSADVLYSFDRLRNEELGSPMAKIYANIKSVVADDATHLTFNLKAPDSEFMASLTDFHAKMLCKGVADPMKELVGTGPFTFKSYAARDRAVLVKNPLYWGIDAQGNQLPYFDEVDFIYSPNTAGQIVSLQGGSLNWVGGLSSKQKQTVEGDPNLKTITTLSNLCFELQIRCDVGPGKKLAFRQALMAGTDLKALVDAVDPGVAVPGNGTLVGPGYKADYLSTTVAYDPAKAKKLLAQAGYRKGVKLKLVAETSGLIPAFATAWQGQMKKIGVTVFIKKVSPGVYYGDKGTDTWTKAPFGIVNWDTREAPITYFQLALATHAPWNYSRWSNAQFDKLCTQVPLTTDAAQRAQLYNQAQQILQKNVPMINFGVLLGVAGESANLDGIVLSPHWAHTVFGTGYFTK